MFQRSDYSWYINDNAKVIEFNECASILDFSNRYGVSDGLEAIYNHIKLYGYCEFYSKNINRQYHIVDVSFDFFKKEEFQNSYECYNFLYNHVILQKRDESIGILLD